nr:hypothetical protein [Tanacetum cinerariifolium]
MKTFLVGHKVLADEVVKLKNGEGTSHNGQDSIDHHSGNQHQSGGGVGNTYKKGNHSYGRLAKIEFPKAVMILKTAKRIECKMQSICPLKVDVADGLLENTRDPNSRIYTL